MFDGDEVLDKPALTRRQRRAITPRSAGRQHERAEPPGGAT